MIKLYHYSNTDFKGYIEPSFFGTNYYTNNDKNISGLARAFYYTKPKPEFLLNNSKYIYIIGIEQGRLYDITKDKARYIDKAGRDIDRALKDIKRHYRGVIYSLSNYKVICLFYSSKIKQRKVLTKPGIYAIL